MPCWHCLSTLKECYLYCITLQSSEWLKKCPWYACVENCFSIVISSPLHKHLTGIMLILRMIKAQYSVDYRIFKGHIKLWIWARVQFCILGAWGRCYWYSITGRNFKMTTNLNILKVEKRRKWDIFNKWFKNIMLKYT